MNNVWFLFYFILFYFILFYFILFYFILFYFIIYLFILQQICDNPKLFVEGASSGDVTQGRLGNCWFVAASSCLAQYKEIWHKVWYTNTGYIIISSSRSDYQNLSYCDGSTDRSIMVDPLCYFLLQPMLHIWCNKCCGIYYPVCGIVYLNNPLLLFENNSPWS